MGVPTKLGGDINCIVHDFGLEFVRPVFASGTVMAEAVITRADSDEDYLKVGIEFVGHNQHGRKSYAERIVVLFSNNSFLRCYFESNT